jgi:hypothetical protein
MEIAGPQRNSGGLDLVDRWYTHLDFRIAYYIAHRMDRATGEARNASPTSLRRFR